MYQVHFLQSFEYLFRFESLNILIETSPFLTCLTPGKTCSMSSQITTLCPPTWSIEIFSTSTLPIKRSDWVSSIAASGWCKRVMRGRKRAVLKRVWVRILKKGRYRNKNNKGMRASFEGKRAVVWVQAKEDRKTLNVTQQCISCTWSHATWSVPKMWDGSMSTMEESLCTCLFGDQKAQNKRWANELP